MLRHDGGVIEANDNLQAALEVCRLVDEAGLGITVGVSLRCVHVALAIHHLIPFPVDDGTTGYTHLEDIRIVGHQADGHKAAKTPSVNTQACSIDVVKGPEEVHAPHLVLHLDLSQMAESGLLKITSAVLAATVVEDEQEIAALGHIGLPTAAAVVPACIHVVGMGSTINIDHRGIFLIGVKIHRHHHAVIQVGAVVSGLDAAATVFGNSIALPGIGSGKVAFLLIVAGVHYGDVAGHVRFLIVVDEVAAAGTQVSAVPTLATLVDAGHLARSDVHAIEVLLDGAVGIGADDDRTLLLVKAQKVHDHPVAAGELLIQFAGSVIDVEMVVAVTLAPQEEFLLVPREERDGMLRLHVFGMGLVVDRRDAITCHGIIGHQVHHVLVAVAFHHIDNVTVGIPRDIGEVAVGGVTRLEIDGVARGHVQHAHPHEVRRLARHGILLGSRRSAHLGRIIQLGNGNQRVVGHHALVHAIEGQPGALRVPEQTALDAELVAVHTLAIDQVARAVAGHLACAASAIGDIQIIVLDIGCSTAHVAPFSGLHIVIDALAPLCLSCLEVDEPLLAVVIDQHQRLVGIGERCHVQSPDL